MSFISDLFKKVLDEKVSPGDVLIDVDTKKEYGIGVTACYEVFLAPTEPTMNHHWAYYETGLGEQKYGQQVWNMKLSLKRMKKQFKRNFIVKSKAVKETIFD